MLNREAWLQKAVRSWRPWFLERGATLPELQVSCGFPSRGVRGKSSRRVGECWAAAAAGDAKPHVLISPTLDDGAEVLAVLLHECVHAALGVKVGHGAPFKVLATSLGLEGPMRATVAGPALQARLVVQLESLGAYPHGKLDLSDRPKQTTRMLKATCSGCGAIIRMSARVAANPGLPTCACGEPFSLDGPGETDGEGV